MANMLENYGLGFLLEDEETYMKFVGHILREGKGIQGYYGEPYIFMPMGDLEFWANTVKREDGKLELGAIHSHCANQCIWEMEYSGFDLTPQDALRTEKTLMFHRCDGDSDGGLLPIEIITVDVLPGIQTGDKVKIQVVALPLMINYYASEEEYADAQPEDNKGEKWLVGNGALLPLNFLYNHNPEHYEVGKDYEDDRFVHFTATVKKVLYGFFEINGEVHKNFIRCFADTIFGEVEFDHIYEQVPESMRDNIRAGAVINGICLLSGDVALHKYEKGVVKDFENNLKLLSDSFAAGDPKRLASVLTEDTLYETDFSDSKYVGTKSILDRFSYIHNKREKNHVARLGTISYVDDDKLDYKVGTRCIVLASNEESDYDSIAFIEVNEEGMITKIKVSTDNRYHFVLD